MTWLSWSKQFNNSKIQTASTTQQLSVYSAKMEIKTILIFGLIGAVCMLVVSGGFISMVTDEQPDATQLFSGAALGGLLGSAASFVAAGKTDELTKSFTDVLQKGGAFVESAVPTTQDMKVGLPNF